jgi:hypothetical protein
MSFSGFASKLLAIGRACRNASVCGRARVFAVITESILQALGFGWPRAGFAIDRNKLQLQVGY